MPVLAIAQRVAAIALLIALSVAPQTFASTPDLSIEYLGPTGPSSFPRLIQIKFVNEKFVNVDLSAVVASLQLAVDGKLVQPQWPAMATVSVAPLDSRDVCISVDDSLPTLTPGPHVLQVQAGAAFGSLRSNTLPLTWSGPRQAPSPDLNVWHKEIHRLTDRLESGVSRSCVDLWLLTKDGGDQAPRTGRYYLGAGTKIDVPFDDRDGAYSLENRVKGKVRVYQENRIND